jgi:DNA gyrase/topoisomerase IV subunit A
MNARGSITMRGVASIESQENRRETIIITELPYQTNKAALIEKIAELAKNSGFEWVQLHGQESANDILKLKSLGLKVIKAISVSNENDLLDCVGEPDLFLFDTQKGEQVVEREWHLIGLY